MKLVGGGLGMISTLLLILFYATLDDLIRRRYFFIFQVSSQYFDGLCGVTDRLPTYYGRLMDPKEVVTQIGFGNRNFYQRNAKIF